MKISTRTVLKNIIDGVIEEWQGKLPDKALESYDNWRTDILDRMEYQLQKRGISLDEVIIEKENAADQKKEGPV